MNNQPSWGEAPEGYPIWIESKTPNERHGWHREEGDSGYRDTSGRLWLKGFEGTDYIVHRRPEWNGEGLPPAGIECEWLQFVHPSIHYVRVKVIGPDEGGVVFRITEGSNKGDYASGDQCMVPNVGPVFRPLLTAEQMAEKQREEKVQRIVDDILGNTTGISRGNARYVAEVLVNHGYEPPKEQGK